MFPMLLELNKLILSTLWMFAETMFLMAFPAIGCVAIVRMIEDKSERSQKCSSSLASPENPSSSTTPSR